jgi:hypothetical protein
MYFTFEVSSTIFSSGWALSSFSTSLRIFSATLTSLAPRERTMLKVTTSWLLKRARLRGSAQRSSTSPRSPRRTVSPLFSWTRVSRSWSTEPAAPRVRMARSEPETVTRPPGRSALADCRAWLTWAAVTPRAARRSGSRATWISRLTPPWRLTWPTPLMASRARLTSLSTNQLRCSGVRVGAWTT